MDYYEPKYCTTIVMDESNRYKIISSFYNITDNVKSSVLFRISDNRIYEFNHSVSESELYRYLKYFYPYYCEKINAQN